METQDKDNTIMSPQFWLNNKKQQAEILQEDNEQ